jgi:U3 small nucleolar RNA-associated protein 15
MHDIRLPPESSNTMTMRHGGAPVEDLLAFPTGGVAVSVGGPILRVWDLNMGKCVRALSNHQKTITCAAFDGTKGRVMTGGLDAMVKVYDVEDWKVVHTMRYPAPLLSLAVSPDDTHIAAGMTDGTLAVRRRDPKQSETSAIEAKQSALSSGSYEYFAEMETIFGTGHIKKKGKDLPGVVGPADEIKIESRRKDKLKIFDKHLKSFKYSAALDTGIQKVCPSFHGSSRSELISDCPTFYQFRSDSRTDSSRWSTSSTLRKGRCSIRANPHFPSKTHYRPKIRRNGITGSRCGHWYVFTISISNRNLS